MKFLGAMILIASFFVGVAASACSLSDSVAALTQITKPQAVNLSQSQADTPKHQGRR